MSKITSREIELSTVLQAVYPVGSIYINASVDTNPAHYLVLVLGQPLEQGELWLDRTLAMFSSMY